MFYSVDLLNIRGGKMSTVWLLGTVKEKEQAALIRKKKAELLRNDLKSIIQELVKRFPVQGKEKSLSLRMSSTLCYGVCINLRVQAEDLNHRVQNLLSLKPVGRDQGIDLPAPTGANLLVLPPLDDELGLLNSDEFQALDSDLLSRAANRGITLDEFPNDRALDFQGAELPLLTLAEINEQVSLLEDPARTIPDNNVGGLQQEAQEDVNGEEVGVCAGVKRKAVEGEDVVNKKARIEDVDVRQAEATLVEASETLGSVAAPCRPGPSNVLPDITITGLNAIPEGQGLSSPNIIDMANVRADFQEVPHQVQVEPAKLIDRSEGTRPEGDVNPEVNIGAGEDQHIHGAHPVDRNEGQVEDLLLQPLVPAPAPVHGRGGRRRLPQIAVDARISLSAREIKASIDEGWKHTLRCESSVQDLVDIETIEPFRREMFGRRLGGTLAQFVKGISREEFVKRNNIWDWDPQLVGGEHLIEEFEEQARPIEPIEQELVELPVEPILTEPWANDGDTTRNSVNRRGELEVSAIGVAAAGISPDNVGPEGSVQPQAGLHPGGNSEVPLTPQKSLLALPGGNLDMPLTPERVLPTVEQANDVANNVPGFAEPEDQDFNFGECASATRSCGLNEEEQRRAESFKEAVESKVVEACNNQEKSCVFQKLFPPEVTSKLEASVAFHQLLKLNKEGKLCLTQDANFGDIVIQLIDSE